MERITSVRNGRVASFCVQEVEGRSDNERIVEGVKSHGLACVVALLASVICCVHIQALSTPNCRADTGQVAMLTSRNMMPPI